MMCRYQCLKSIADAICIIIIGTLSGNQLDSMALGAGLKHDDESFGERLMLVVGIKIIANAINCFKHDF